jgi:hypothetical protein
MILYCKSCAARVKAEYQNHYSRRAAEEGLYERVSFLSCPSCRDPFLVIQAEYGMDEYGNPEVIYPQAARINPNLPRPILTAYSEADACLRARAYTATAIMCRKTLEGLCSEHGATKGTLATRLKDLRDRGVIENRLFEWADALRLSGNEAAHEVEISVSAEDARDLLEFTNALLEYVFTFRDRFDAFQRRRRDSQRGSQD